MAIKEAHRNRAPLHPRREVLIRIVEIVAGVGIAGLGGVAVVEVRQLFDKREKTDSAAKIVPAAATDGVAPTAGDAPRLATPQAVSTAEATATPTPLEQAVSDGRLVLNEKDPQDWEKYFAAVTKEEAAAMLAEANKDAPKGEVNKTILPFDPRLSPGLEIVPFTGVNKGFNISKFGLRNVGIGTIFYARASGLGWIQDSRNSKGSIGTFADGVIDADRGLTFTARFSGSASPEPINRPFADYRGRLPISFGAPMLKITGVGGHLDYDEPNSSYQVDFDVQRFSNGSDIKALLGKLLTKNGKIAFIAQDYPQGK